MLGTGAASGGGVRCAENTAFTFDATDINPAAVANTVARRKGALETITW